jgi:outer membrane lipoprotein carrier protein
MKKIRYILGLFLVIFVSTTLANTPSQQLDELLSNFHAMRADFQQKTLVKNGVSKASSGNMALKRPGKFRWEITQPNHQLIVADGQYLWVYDVDLEQASRKNLTKDTNSPAILLSGSSHAIEQRFTIIDFQTEGNRSIFKLKPKANQDMFQRVDLEFTDRKLSKMAVIDNLGQKNIFNFSSVEINPNLSNALFQFHAPHGVDVIKE